MKRIIFYLKLMRFDRPIGIILLLWPALWGLLLASKNIPSIKLLIIFVLGAIVTRALGCVLNDIADRKFDPLVERTKHRPLAAKKLFLAEALALVVILATIAFYLVVQTNTLTVHFAVAAAVLMFFYPLTKRFLAFPQVILGITFGAWPVLMGFTAVQNHLPLPAYLLAAAACCWTIAYDTIYALADKKDDLQIGIKSTAILFGRHVMLGIMCFQFLMLSLLIAVGILEHLGAWYYSSIVLALILFIYQYDLIELENSTRCIKAFRHNKWVGLVIFLGIFLTLL
jgi:4-hydroxybenzoate polyprenyltransferase